MTDDVRNPKASSNIECPNCGAIGVETRFVNDRFKYGVDSSAVDLEARIPFRHCPSCEFDYTDADAEDLRHEAICRHLKRMIPTEVAGIRKHYDLRRDEFAAKTRLGEASLARWESGQLIQNAAYDNYLFLLTFEENMKRLEERPLSIVLEPMIRLESPGEDATERLWSDRAQLPQNRFRALANPEHVQRAACRFYLRRTARVR
jgi:DNA-binding transcriptional regulator YiaG